MTQPLDVAYVQILPDLSDFSRRAVRDITRAAKEIERQIRSAFDDVEDAARDAGRTIAISITVGAKTAEKAIDNMADSANRDFKRVSRAASEAGGGIASAFSNFGKNAFNAVATGLTSLGETLATSFNPAGLILLIVQLGILAALGPPLVGVAAALASLAGVLTALPAVIGVVVAAFAPLIVAFQNFGDAVSAISEGDPEKIAEALKKLAPAAAAVAKEFGSVLPAFKDFQRASQQAVFAPLVGDLTLIATRILPVLKTGFTAVGGAFGGLLDKLIEFFAANEQLRTFQALFATTARIITTLTPTITKLLGSFFRAIDAGLPLAEQLASGFGNALGKFADFISGAIADGSFQKFFDDAIKTAKSLFALLGEVGTLIGTLFGATEENGRGFIDTLTQATAKVNEFFKSDVGQKQLKDFAEAIKVTGGIVLGFVDFLISLNNHVAGVQKDFKNMKTAVSGALSAVGDFFARIGTAISELPGKVGDFLSSLPQRIGEAFKKAGETALFAIGVFVGSVLFAFTRLPEEIGKFFASIPDRVRSALTTLGPVLLQIFDDALTAVGNFITTRFDEFLNFIRTVPDRISALGPQLLQAGRNLIAGFFSGLGQAGSFISEVAGNIVGALKSGLNKAIDKVNEGIAAVDNALPGTLPRIPRLAKGGIIPATPGGQLFIGGEAGEDEVVAPLSKFEKMMNGGTVINVGANAFNIIFEGTVPTESQARATGQAVADGWLSELARRNVRLETRAI